MKYLNKMKLLIFILWLAVLSACSSPNINDYKASAPSFDLFNYFSGNLEAKGVVINRSGLVTRRFSVQILGTVDENMLTLEEWFVFDDGEKTERTWVITKNNDGSYSGTAGDIIGVARGESQGMAVHWDYQIDLEVEEKIYRVVFDDWLYLIDEDNVINRSVIKKWGFNVGEVILSIRKIYN